MTVQVSLERRTAGLPTELKCFGVRLGGSLSHTVGIRSPVFAIIWGLQTDAPVCRRVLRRWLLQPCQGFWTSFPHNVAAASCEADAPCSVVTALYPLWPLKLFLPVARLSSPLYFCRLLASLECLRWQTSMRMRNEQGRPSFFAC